MVVILGRITIRIAELIVVNDRGFIFVHRDHNKDNDEGDDKSYRNNGC